MKMDLPGTHVIERWICILGVFCLLGSAGEVTGSQSGKGNKAMENIDQDIVLTCSPEFLPDKLRMRYSVTNRGSQDIYVLDGFYHTRYADPKKSDYSWVYLCLKDSNAAYLLIGIPPLPEDRMVAVRVIPLATRLSPGRTIKGMFELAFPLREENAYYYAPGSPEGYDPTKIKKLILAVQFLRPTVEGFNAEPAPHAPDLFRVRGKITVGQAETVTCDMAVRDLQMLRRKGSFSRL